MHNGANLVDLTKAKLKRANIRRDAQVAMKHFLIYCYAFLLEHFVNKKECLRLN